MRTVKAIESDLLDLADALHSLTKDSTNIYFVDLQVFADSRRDLMQELRQAQALENCR